MFSLHSFIKNPNDTQISLEGSFTLIIKLFNFSKTKERSLENCSSSGKCDKIVKNCPKRLEKRKKRAQKHVSQTAKRIKLHSICPSGRLIEIYSWRRVFLVLFWVQRFARLFELFHSLVHVLTACVHVQESNQWQRALWRYSCKCLTTTCILFWIYLHAASFSDVPRCAEASKRVLSNGGDVSAKCVSRYGPFLNVRTCL